MYSIFVTRVSPSAISPAITIAAQALKSQEVTSDHFKSIFQKIIASCGFKIAVCHLILSSSTKKLSLHSKSISCIFETQSACVISIINGEPTSVGNPGKIFV